MLILSENAYKYSAYILFKVRKIIHVHQRYTL